MKRNKDIQAQEKARSHGYYWPYRQWGHSDDTIRTFIYPIKMNKLIGVYLTGAYAYGYVFNEKINQCDFHMRNDEKILTETASRYILVIGV